MKLICPNCKARYEKGKFCLECGTPLIEVSMKKILFCPECQIEFEKGKFCPECGTKLEEREVEVGTTANTEKKETDASSVEVEVSNVKSVIPSNPIDSSDPEIEAVLVKYRNEYGDIRELNQEEYAVAFEELQMCASKGNPEAMCFLATLYIDGKGVTKDDSKAYKLLREAESKGSKYASAILSIFYIQGLFVERDIDEALRRLNEGYKATKIPEIAGIIAMINQDLEEFEKAFEYAQTAAVKGSKTGCKVLGDLYLNGRAVEQDDHKAFDYYMQAAAQGEEDAFSQIGWMYMEGRGVDENSKQAFFWFNESAQKNSDVGMFNVACCYRDGYGVEQDIEKAAEWFKKSAEAGYVDAMTELGVYYQNTLVDDEKSKQWLKKAADLGSAKAINRLGVIYLDYEENFDEAVKCFKSAMDMGFPNAYRNLALCYRDGKGVKKDLKKAEELLAKAAELGIEDASEIHEEMIASNDKEQLNEAASLMNEEKYKEGCAIFRELAKQGNPRAQRNYGHCLLKGTGVKQNLEEAVSWLNKAAEHNDCYAYLILAEAYLGNDYNGKKLKEDFRKADAYLKKAYELGADPDEVLEVGQKSIPSVEISKLKTKSPYRLDGDLGVEVTFQMQTQRMVGRILNITAYCVNEYDDIKCLKYPAKSINDPLECMYFENFKAPYLTTVWESFHFFIPYYRILNTQNTVQGTLVLMVWDQTDKKAKLLACEEIPYVISCKTHIFSSNEWEFKRLNRSQHTRLVKQPEQKKYVLPEKTEVVELTENNIQPIQKGNNILPMDEIRRAADATYPKESLKSLAGAVLKIAEVIQERLPDADVSYMVHPSTFDSTCSLDALPVHFLFKKNGKPKVAVVAVTQNGYRATHVLKTADCCAKNGIAYVKVFANGSYADWIQGWSEFTPYGPERHGPVTPATVEFCKNWLVEKITRNL